MKIIKLPIPVIYNDKSITEIEIKPALTGIMADTRKEIQNGNAYRALQIFLTGCIENIDTITDKTEIRIITENMPYKSADYAILQIVCLGNDRNNIEGIYKCPRCDNEMICEYDEVNDTSDYIEDLGIKYLEENKTFNVSVSNIDISKFKDESIEFVNNLEFQHPTLNHCIKALNKYSNRDNLRLQLAIYLEALVSINNIPIEAKQKNRYGMYIFEKMIKKELQEIEKKVNEYGVDTEVEKICNKCGKEFSAVLNTSNFFVSALQ